MTDIRPSQLNGIICKLLIFTPGSIIGMLSSSSSLEKIIAPITHRPLALRHVWITLWQWWSITYINPAPLCYCLAFYPHEHQTILWNLVWGSWQQSLPISRHLQQENSSRWSTANVDLPTLGDTTLKLLISTKGKEYSDLFGLSHYYQQK